jgi:hypothetical protein
VQFDKEASQTRDYWVAKSATHRAARPDPSLRKERLLRMTSKLHHYQKVEHPTNFRSETQIKKRVEGVGQECPTHTICGGR